MPDQASSKSSWPARRRCRGVLAAAGLSSVAAGRRRHRPGRQRRHQRGPAAGRGSLRACGADRAAGGPSCRTSRRGGTPTGRSGRSRSGPGTVWRRCCGAPPVRAAAGEPAHRPLQRGVGAASAPAGRGRPDPVCGSAPADPRHRRRAVRHGRRRRGGGRASRTRRGGVVRQRRRDLSAVELAAGPPHPAA